MKPAHVEYDPASVRVLGWRVLPGGRKAHMIYLTDQKVKYRTACGSVHWVSYLRNEPAAKRCSDCEFGIDPGPESPA